MIVTRIKRFHVLKFGENELTDMKIEEIHSFHKDNNDEVGEDEDDIAGGNEFEQYEGTE